jgi:glycosyltransferase involved in cell wall biosynthesis
MALVVQDHASGLPPPSTAGRAIRRWGFRGVDTFLFTSARLADPWRAASIIRRRQLVHEVLEASTAVRPMARDTAREASGIAGSPALLWVGRLNANKDPMTVLAGFERIAVPYPEASLTMVFGSDELLPQVQAKVMASSALAGRVRLVGYVPPAELPAYYSAADIFVLGSHHEGSGYALIEACACGAVPVVTSIPSFRVITRDGAHGALWAPGDAIGLSHALSETAGRDLAALRADVTRHFASELSWKAVGRRALDIYAEVHARRLGSS